MGFENGKLVAVRLRAADAVGHECVSVLHYDLDDGSLGETPNDPQSLADTVRDDLATPWKAILPTTWTADPVVVYMEKDPQNPTGLREEWASSAIGVGVRSISGQEFLPYGTCAVATLKSANIGRRHTGRMFIPIPLLEGDQSAGVLVAGIITAINTLLDAIPRQPDIAGGTSTATANWTVYSRTQRAADADPYASTITSTLLRTATHYLRSRERV